MYWFKGESFFSCLAMSRKQLMMLYVESFRIEAKEQIRLVLASRYGDSNIDCSEYLDGLIKQANPVSIKEDEKMGIEGFQKAMSMFGSKVTGNVEVIEYKK